MEILVLTREYPPNILGGLSYHLKHLYNEIARKGHQIDVIAGNCGTSDRVNLDVHDDISIDYIPFKNMRLHRLRLAYKFKSALRDVNIDKYDICFTHTALPFDISIPVVWKIHDCLYKEREFIQNEGSTMSFIDAKLDRVRKYIDQTAYNKADHVVFISDILKESHTALFDIPPHTTIYNGIDRTVFYPRDVPKGEHILHVGGSKRKGIEELKRLAGEISTEIKVAGIDSIETNGMTALGRLSQDELAEEYSKAQVTVHPAKFEPFGNILLESISCGTPVVANDSCGAIKIMDECCAVVSDSLSDSVTEAAKLNSEDCVRVAKEYSWESVATETIRVGELQI